MDSLPSNPSRKRARSPDADCEECMPISKRIHNLNIRSRGCSIDDDGVDCDAPMNNNVQVDANCCCSTNRCHPQPGTSASTDSAQWLSNTAGGTIPHPHHHHHHHHHNGHGPSGNPHHSQTGPHPYPCALPQDHFQGNGQCHQTNHLPGCIPQLPNMNGLEPYEPELDASANPHYYHQNRLLYVAHIERVRRTKPD